MDILKRTPFIRLEHGSGGALSRELVEELIYPILKSDMYTELNDAACISVKGDLMYTTDTYVIDPPFFPGGDIGKLAVFGTCNDLAVSGAKPLFLSMGLVLEEGFPLEHLVRILKSASSASKEYSVSILTGDTKVVPQGKGGGIFINTSGIGEKHFPEDLSAILNEIAFGAPFGIETEEVSIPILDSVRSVSDILGLNPLDVANEGVFVAVVSPDAADSAVEELSRFETGKLAAVIGRVIEDHVGRVVLRTEIGGTRILDFPRGLLLPRIC